MARPIKDKRSGIFLFKERVPRDLQHIVTGKHITLPSENWHRSCRRIVFPHSPSLKIQENGFLL